MTTPTSTHQTSDFPASGQLTIDALLNEGFVKWGGGLGAGTTLGYSFPWMNGSTAYWQTPVYSSADEPGAASHFGFNTAQAATARQALQAWSNVANIQFAEITETPNNVGDIRFAFSSAVDGLAWGWAGYPSEYWPGGGDIWIATDVAQDTDWSPGTYNYQALMHEIGHALGLKHPGDYGGGSGPYLPSELDNYGYTLMSYNANDNVYPEEGWSQGQWSFSSYYINVRTPMVLDIAAIQYLYGANLKYRTGNDTYTFDGRSPFFETLWDAGGTDTIDVSACLRGTVIDLRPGHYSSIYLPPPSNSGGIQATYDGTNALGIAYGCLIENVIGSAGNDTIYENSANNTINGGGGNDTLWLTGKFADYRFTIDPLYQWLTLSHNGSQEKDKVQGIETLRFSDRSVEYAQLLKDMHIGPDTEAPIVNGFSPSDGTQSALVEQNIVVIFNEAIKRGTGSIVLKSGANHAVETFDATSSGRLTLSGTILTIDPTAPLDYNTHYWIEFANGSIADLAGNKYAGTVTYDFSTMDRKQAGKTITGTPLADQLIGSSANDTLIGHGGNDVIDGGEGVDSFRLDVSTYDLINHSRDLVTGPGFISRLGSSLGTITLHSVERVQLTDGLYAFDTRAPSITAPEGGSVWQAQALYQAAFGHHASTQELSRWTAEADRLGDMGQLGQAFIDFYAQSVNTTDLVYYLYTMLTHTEGSQQEIQNLVAQIGAGKTYETQGDFLAWAAQLPINTVNLIGFTDGIADLDPTYF